MTENKRIYLAAPYTDMSASIRHFRYKAVSRACVELMQCGFAVFSPITHSHYLAEHFGLLNMPDDFWKAWYMTFLKHWATYLYVLQLQGWENSGGVKTEIEYAQSHGIPITYIWGLE